MTNCRTGCGAEINYKRVHFSSPVDWYDVPMQNGGVLGDVIHDCPKLKPSTNDAANDVLKELGFMHLPLHEYFLDGMVMEYGLVEYSDLVDLPQELKMHSKEKLAERIIRKEDIHNHHMGGEMPREDFDKLPKSEKDDYKEFFGVEPPNQTPEERQENFRVNITHIMSFLQRCTYRFPAPFYRYGGYSQLELFRIFLESKEQYADAMNCHIIQGAVDIAGSKMDADAFIEVTGRLQKKLDAQRLANEWTSEDTLAEKKRLMSLGMDEKEAESEAEMAGVTHEWEEKGEREYPASQMIWALKQYRKEFDNPDRVYGEAVTADLEKELAKSGELEAMEREGLGPDQIEVGDTVDKEQSLDEMTNSHSQEYFGPFHEGFRNLILFIYNDEEEVIWKKWPLIYDYCKHQRDKQKKKLYKMKYKDNLLGHATMGQLVQIFDDEMTKMRSMGYVKCGVCSAIFNSQSQLRNHFGNKHKSADVSSVKIEGRMVEYDELLLHFKEILLHRNMMDHDEREELPKERKALLVPLIFIVNEFFKELNNRYYLDLK